MERDRKREEEERARVTEMLKDAEACFNKAHVPEESLKEVRRKEREREAENKEMRRQLEALRYEQEVLREKITGLEKLKSDVEGELRAATLQV